MSIAQITSKISPLLGKLKSKQEVSKTPSIRLACDCGRSKVVFVELEKSESEFRLQKFANFTYAKETLPQQLKECRENSGFGTDKLRLSLKGQGVIVRFISFPKMKPEELKAALVFETEKYIPFKVTDVIVDYHILSEHPDEPNMELLLVAVKRDEVYPYIQPFQEAGFQIEMIDIDAIAGINALGHSYPAARESTVALLDIGTEVSTLSVIQKGIPKFIRDISYGGLDMIKKLKRKLSMSDADARKQLDGGATPAPEAIEVLKEGIGDLVTDVKVSVDYYMDQVHNAEPVSKLYLCGGGGYLPIVIDAFTQHLGSPVECLNALERIMLGDLVDKQLVEKNKGILAVAMGLALRDK